MDHTIRGTTMPVLEVRLAPNEQLMADTGSMSWMAGVELETVSRGAGGGGVAGMLKKAARSAMSGESLMQSRFTAGSDGGMVAFASKLPGQILPLEFDGARELHVARGAWLAASESIRVDMAMKLSVGKLAAGTAVMQKITGTGTVFLEIGGEMVTYELPPGGTLTVERGHLAAHDAGVGVELTRLAGVKNRLLGGEDSFLLRLTGPGSVWLRSASAETLAAAIEPYITAPGQGGGPLGGIGDFLTGE